MHFTVSIPTYVFPSMHFIVCVSQCAFYSILLKVCIYSMHLKYEFYSMHFTVSILCYTTHIMHFTVHFLQKGTVKSRSGTRLDSLAWCNGLVQDGMKN